MFFPAGTPREIVGTINAGIGKALETKAVRSLFEQDALTPVGGTPEELGAHLKREIDRYAGDHPEGQRHGAVIAAGSACAEHRRRYHSICCR